MPKSTSTVDTTKTTTTTASKTVGTNKGPRVRTGPSVFQLAADQWAVMSGDERNSYAAASGQMTDAMEPNAPTRKSAYSTFVALSAANIAVSQPILTTALPYSPAQPLPAVQVKASYVNKQLTVLLVPSAPYPYPVALKMARPLLASDSVSKSAAFKKIGSVPNLNGTVDITNLVKSRYRVLSTGYKVALELMGVAPGGFHTSDLFASGVVSNVAAEDALTEPEATKLAIG